MAGPSNLKSNPTAPDSSFLSSDIARRAARVAAFVALGAGLVVLLGPLVATGRPKPPFGRPWFLGTGSLLLAAYVATSYLQARRTGWRDAWEKTRRSRLAAGFFFCYLVFVANETTLSSGDNLPNRALPLALVSGHGLDLSTILPAELHDHYSILELNGQLVSAFPLGTGLLATPYYAAAILVRGTDRGELLNDARLEKHLAALLTSASVVFVFLAAGACFTPRYQLLCAALYALATQVLPTLSQGLWSFTGEHFFLALALAVLATRRQLAWAASAGLLLGLAYFCRPTALLLLPLAWSFAGGVRSRRVATAAGLAVAATAATMFNLWCYGHFLGGYGLLNSSGKAWAVSGILWNLAGVLASPSRGALWFFPAAMLALLMGGSRSDLPGVSGLRRSAAMAVVAILLLTATYTKWWGGYSLGPRLLAELSIPSAFLITASLIPNRRRWLRYSLGVLAVLQVAENLALQHSSRAQGWNAEVLVDKNPEARWSLRNSQLAAVLPGWEYVSTRPYFQLPEQAEDDSEEWEPVDLSGLANGRYDAISTPDEEDWRDLRLKRLAAAEPAERDASFIRVIAPGRPNLIRVCRGETSPAIPMPPKATRRIATLIAWRSAAPPVHGRAVGSLLLRFANDRLEARLLREGSEVFDTSRSGAKADVREHRLFAGSQFDRDALILQRFTLSGRNRIISSITLERADEAPNGCLFLLGLSVSAPDPGA